MELKHATEKRMTTQKKLLIVPYGIETRFFIFSKDTKRTFNRTLWN